MSTWTKEETLQLVKLYKSYPNLWNRNLYTYRNKEEREGALLSIMSKMGPDKFKSAQDVKVKINSMRMQYHQVLKKIETLKMKGSRYKPPMNWFKDFQEIMDVGKLKPLKQITDRKQISDEIVIEYSEPTSTSNDITSVNIESMPDAQNTPNIESHSTSPATVNVAPIPVKRIKLEQHDIYSAGPSHNMSRQEREKVNDEFQMFADNIAEQLRKLPLDTALKIQLDIQSIVAGERTQLYRKYTRKGHK